MKPKTYSVHMIILSEPAYETLKNTILPNDQWQQLQDLLNPWYVIRSSGIRELVIKVHFPAILGHATCIVVQTTVNRRHIVDSVFSVLVQCIPRTNYENRYYSVLFSQWPWYLLNLVYNYFLSVFTVLLNIEK